MAAEIRLFPTRAFQHRRALYSYSCNTHAVTCYVNVIMMSSHQHMAGVVLNILEEYQQDSSTLQAMAAGKPV